jgi:hypothetical protein
VDLASVPDLLGETPRCNALLADVLDRNEGYVNFGLIQLNGDVSCSAVPMLHPVNLGDRNHFKRAIMERRFIAGDYVFGRVIRRHTINLTYPVIDRAARSSPSSSRRWTWPASTPSSPTSTCRPARCW